VAVARNGDIYVADTLNNRIRTIAHATGFIATIAGDGRTVAGEDAGDAGLALRAQLDRPDGLAIAQDGDLYVADTGHNLVRRVSADTGMITTIAGDGRAGSTGDGGPAIRASLARQWARARVWTDNSSSTSPTCSTTECA
jgi:sugar lactone lactonase YvrE